MRGTQGRWSCSAYPHWRAHLHGEQTAIMNGLYPLDPSRVIAEDLSHSSGEKRYYCFGRIEGGVLTVRFTYRDDVIRIFGAGYWRRGKAIYERENQIQR